jgi:TonB family protein
MEETVMKQIRSKHRGRTIKGLQVTALAMAFAFCLPLLAAGERAVKSRVSPVYPELAKRMRITGMVTLEAKVDADGKVVAVKTLTGNRALSPAAEDAVSRWRFVTAPEPSTVTVDVNFALAQ